MQNLLPFVYAVYTFCQTPTCSSSKYFPYKLELDLDSAVDSRACDRHQTNKAYSLGRSYIEAVNLNHNMKKLPKYGAIIA